MPHLNLRKIRQHRHLSLDQLALLSGVNRTTIHRIEAGLVSPRVDTLKALCQALAAELPDLFDGPSPEPGAPPPSISALPPPIWQDVAALLEEATRRFQQIQPGPPVEVLLHAPLPRILADPTATLQQIQDLLLAARIRSPAQPIHLRVSTCLQPQVPEPVHPIHRIPFHACTVHVEVTTPADRVVPLTLELSLPLRPRTLHASFHLEHPMEPQPASSYQVLIAEDNDTLRSCIAEYLTLLGHRPLEAHHGQEALDLFLAQPEAIDLVIMDLHMPVMNGVAAIREIKKHRPDARIVIATGAIEASDLADMGLTGHFAFLRKPFSLHDLLFLLDQIQPKARTS